MILKFIFRIGRQNTKSLINKIVFLSLSLSFVLNINVPIIASNTTSVSNGEDIETSEEIAARLNKVLDYGNIVSKDNIQFENYEIQLYVEFENPTLSLNELINTYTEFVNYLKDTYNLDNISLDNFQTYYEKFQLSLDDYSNPYKDNAQLIIDFIKFYDIYENKEKNNEIIQLTTQLSSKILNTFNVQLNSEVTDLAMIIPTYNDLFIDVNEGNLNTNEGISLTAGLSGTSLTNAINYAQTYATSYNTYSYAMFSADCTNFASQILEASGRSQDVTDYVVSGWWHKVENNEHVHSNSWIRADTFARYMGIWSRYSSIQTLSLNLQKGDFIAKDASNDGDYDHIGFVTAIDSTQRSYTDEDGATRTYKDFRVAQHSTNYLRYVSNDGNDWKKFADEGARVAIVGRSYTGN